MVMVKHIKPQNSPNDIRVFNIIVDCGRLMQPLPSFTVLAKKLGLSDATTITACLRRLETSGIIKLQCRKGSDLKTLVKIIIIASGRVVHCLRGRNTVIPQKKINKSAKASRETQHAPPDDVPMIGVSMMELTERSCRYPYGDHEITFCGKEALPKKSWCAEHHAIVMRKKNEPWDSALLDAPIKNIGDQVLPAQEDMPDAG